MPSSPCKKLLTLSLALAAPSLWANESTIGDLAMNTAANLPPYSSMITGFAYIMGLAFIVSGVVKLKRHAENPQQVPMLAPVIFTTMGVLLLYFPTTIDVLRDTFFAGGEATTGMELYSSGQTMDGTTADTGS